jgi:glycosyltransferase involved in cell wall biosynthesis
LLLVWILISLALILGLLALSGDRERARFIARELEFRLEDDLCPPATVIVPVKGIDEGLAANLAALEDLDYPDYELIVVACQESDVPYASIPPDARLVIAGVGDPDTGEKVNNLLAAVEAARPESRIYAFADSDGRVKSGWLRALAGALRRGPRVGAATGYRWHIPARGGFWSLLRSAWNAVIAGGFGPGDNSFVWGGAMAMRRETFRSSRVTEYWRGAVSDDFKLAQAVHDAGFHIAFAPGAMVAARDHTTAAQFFEWIVRQMRITRAYRPRLWWPGLIAHLVYCGAMVLSVPFAPAALIVQIGFSAVKGRNRAVIARSYFPEDAEWFRRHGWVYTWSGPLVTWVWLYAFLGSAMSRRIVWRGREYYLR